MFTANLEMSFDNLMFGEFCLIFLRQRLYLNTCAVIPDSMARGPGVKPRDAAGHEQVVGAAAWQQATVWHLSVMDTSMLRDAAGCLRMHVSNLLCATLQDTFPIPRR